VIASNIYQWIQGIFEDKTIAQTRRDIAKIARKGLILHPKTSKAYIYGDPKKGGLGFTDPIWYAHSLFLKHQLRLLNGDNKVLARNNYNQRTKIKHFPNTWKKFQQIIDQYNLTLEQKEDQFLLSWDGSILNLENNKSSEGKSRKDFKALVLAKQRESYTISFKASWIKSNLNQIDKKSVD